MLAFDSHDIPNDVWMGYWVPSMKYGATSIAVLDAAYGAVSQRIFPIVYNTFGLLDYWTSLARNLNKERTGYDENYIGPRTSSE